eukprot:GHVR01007741.1.p1 GENE.GHVR01007741.1~~GHVR01007741.1.p1  ORF type:complete len:102 (+),score=40.99 GHVR01007741.1:548-853(+)
MVCVCVCVSIDVLSLTSIFKTHIWDTYLGHTRIGIFVQVLIGIFFKSKLFLLLCVCVCMCVCVCVCVYAIILIMYASKFHDCRRVCLCVYVCVVDVVNQIT